MNSNVEDMIESPHSTMAKSNISNLHPPLPTELFQEIVGLLSLADQRTLSLVSRLTRTIALESIFGQLQYTGRITPKLRGIHQASNDVKDVIKSVRFHMVENPCLITYVA